MAASSTAVLPESDGEDVADFIQTFCRHIKGEQRGKLISLEAWQVDLLIETFEIGEDGAWRYREALWGMPRKNGKSTVGAGIALYGLVAAGEPGAEVYSCAGDKEQAKIVFGDARQMVELDPELSGLLKVYKDAIEHPQSGSVYRALSAEAFTKEGLNPFLVIFDELHVQPNRDLYDVMTQGSGTRWQAMLLAITTAGYDLDTICGQKYTYGQKVRAGEIDDPTFFFRWWEPARADCDYRDPAVWAEVNPGLGKFLHAKDLAALVGKTPENVIRRYRLNQWTTSAEAWLPFGAWEACAAPDLELDPRLPLRVAIDVALRNDSTAVVCAQRQQVGPEHAPKPHTARVATEEEDRPSVGEGPHYRIVVRAKVWENPFPDDDPRHAEWTLNIFEVEEYLRGLRAAFPEPATEIDGAIAPGPEFSYDPAYFERSAQVLEGDGLAMVEYPQHDSRMVPASQGLYQLVVEGRLAHNGDPALARHVANASAAQKPRGWRLTKPKGSRKKIDAAISCAIAAHRAQEPSPVRRRSVYEDRGMVSA